jgi:Sulfotransferase family
MITALAARYSSNPAVKIVAASFANANTEDWAVPHTPPEVTAWFAAGYTSARMCLAQQQMLRSASVDREALIFLRIPKTAGTTLNTIIEWQYNPVSIFTVDPHRIRATVARFKTFSEQRRRRFRVVRGHLLYGIHEFLPQGATYITRLREPGARLLSTYAFILRRPLHPLHRALKTGRLSAEDIIRMTPYRQNLQCRFIWGIGRYDLR